MQKRRVRARGILKKSHLPPEQSPSSHPSPSPDKQQLVLSERRRTFSFISGAAMVGESWSKLTDADIALLPHVNWSQISLLHFLGSGTFGEVYEGLLNLSEGTSDMEKGEVIKVTIKVNENYSLI